SIVLSLAFALATPALRSSSSLLLSILPPPRSTLFPYTTLFRSYALVLVGTLPFWLATAIFVLAFIVIFERMADETRQRSFPRMLDRKSTRLNSSHVKISYAVFCLKKKKQTRQIIPVSLLKKKNN